MKDEDEDDDDSVADDCRYWIQPVVVVNGEERSRVGKVERGPLKKNVLGSPRDI